VQTAVRKEQYPIEILPEAAFVGRSNVGKSSLINTLLNRKKLARVASTPGKTRQINFYNIDDKLSFVDLPGYGYAKVAKSTKDTWSDIIDTYLTSRKQLKMIVMIVDIRHSPSEHDIMMYKWILSMQLPHIIAASKLDKIPRSKIKERVQDINKVLKTDDGIKIIPFSSETKHGKDELWNEIVINTGLIDESSVNNT
jgi:GTP-binding protein